MFKIVMHPVLKHDKLQARRILAMIRGSLLAYSFFLTSKPN